MSTVTHLRFRPRRPPKATEPSVTPDALDVVQRDDGLFQVGIEYDAPGFPTRTFASAIASSDRERL